MRNGLESEQHWKPGRVNLETGQVICIIKGSDSESELQEQWKGETEWRNMYECRD